MISSRTKDKDSGDRTIDAVSRITREQDQGREEVAPGFDECEQRRRAEIGQAAPQGGFEVVAVARWGHADDILQSSSGETWPRPSRRSPAKICHDQVREE